MLFQYYCQSNKDSSPSERQPQDYNGCQFSALAHKHTADWGQIILVFTRQAHKDWIHGFSSMTVYTMLASEFIQEIANLRARAGEDSDAPNLFDQ